MKRLLFILTALVVLTSCTKPELPDPDMRMPTEPPNADLMQPTVSPTE